MKKITRGDFDVKPFASEAQGQERTIFGVEQQSDDMLAQVNSQLLRGWGTVGNNDYPPKQWFNAVSYFISLLVAHQYQNGIAEWCSNQEYYTNNLTKYNNRLYFSLKGTNGNPNVNKRPDTASDFWQDILKMINASDITKGTLPVAQVPALPASKITSGTLSADRIPALNANKINAGTLAVDRIPSIPTTKITGTLPVAQGGTGATAVRGYGGATNALFPDYVPNPTSVMGITDNFTQAGYTPIANLKNMLGLQDGGQWMPKPTNNAGPGQIHSFGAWNFNPVLPAGGTWLIFKTAYGGMNGFAGAFVEMLIVPGGSDLRYLQATNMWVCCAWRIQ